MFRLDLQLFNAIYQNCKFIGEGLGMTVVEGAIINFIIVSGTIITALNTIGAKKEK